MQASRRNPKQQAWGRSIGGAVTLGMALVALPPLLHAQVGIDLGGMPCRYYVIRQVDSGGIPMVKSDSVPDKVAARRSDTLRGAITGRVLIDTTATMPLGVVAEKNMDSILRAKHPRVIDVQLDCNIKTGP